VIEDGLFSIESASQGEREDGGFEITRRYCQFRIQTLIPTLFVAELNPIAILDGCRHIGDKIRLISGNCFLNVVCCM
jgi:hypothetical protein